MRRWTMLLMLSVWGALFAPVIALEPCRIRVIEKNSGWPVPLVELRTVHGVRLVSDNVGVVAFDLPEMMGREIWLHIEGHGYTVPADGFGYRGVRVTPTAGGELTLEVERQLPGRRLGRITGAGLFAEAQRFGEFQDWKEQGIVGCDSVQCAVHREKLFWVWGDTSLATHPLGLFHALGGTTEVQPLSRFEPPIRLRYDYFRDEKGNPRSIAKLPGEGPTWLSGLVSLADAEDRPRLVATYTKIQPPLTAYEQGLCVWNEEAKRFEQHRELWTRSNETESPPPCPEGHVTHWKDSAGEHWLLFGDPFPRIKCEASFEAWSNPDRWTVLQPQSQVKTADGTEPLEPHRGSIAYNHFLEKWVTVFTQFGGSSPLGELWFAMADSPLGPWHSAVKVVTHNNYSFYNPRLHAEWATENSPILLFEATYTAEFANHACPTPRHNYNQVLYRLDLKELKSQVDATAQHQE